MWQLMWKRHLLDNLASFYMSNWKFWSILVYHLIIILASKLGLSSFTFHIRWTLWLCYLFSAQINLKYHLKWQCKSFIGVLNIVLLAGAHDTRNLNPPNILNAFVTPKGTSKSQSGLVPWDNKSSSFLFLYLPDYTFEVLSRCKAKMSCAVRSV